MSPPPVANDVTTPVRGSDDLRFISTKSLNLQPAIPTPLPAKSSTLSPPPKTGRLPASSASVPSSRHRQPHRDAPDSTRPQHYQSTDAVVLTTPDVAAPPDVISSAAPPVCSVLTSSRRRSDEKYINEDWRKMVAAASSDQINLVSFHDSAGPVASSGNAQFSSADTISYTSSTVPRNSGGARKTSSPGTVIFTLQASPPVKGRSPGVTLRSIQDACLTSPESSPKPLSFANPLYSHVAKDTARRGRAVDAKSNNSGASYGDGDVIGKQSQALPLTHAGIGVGRGGRKFRGLAASTESLDSVVASRPASKRRDRPAEPSLTISHRISQSTSYIDRSAPSAMPRRVLRRNGETSTPAERGIDQRESDFGALKRLWQSIELPTSPSSSAGSAKSYPSPVRCAGKADRRQHSASFDTGLSDFGCDRSTRRGHSCDSLLTDGSAPRTHQMLATNRGILVDVDDQSEVNCGLCCCIINV